MKDYFGLIPHNKILCPIYITHFKKVGLVFHMNAHFLSKPIFDSDKCVVLGGFPERDCEGLFHLVLFALKP